jgi:hypothetical protein
MYAYNEFPTSGKLYDVIAEEETHIYLNFSRVPALHSLHGPSVLRLSFHFLRSSKLLGSVLTNEKEGAPMRDVILIDVWVIKGKEALLLEGTRSRIGREFQGSYRQNIQHQLYRD